MDVTARGWEDFPSRPGTGRRRNETGLAIVTGEDVLQVLRLVLEPHLALERLPLVVGERLYIPARGWDQEGPNLWELPSRWDATLKKAQACLGQSTRIQC